MNSCAEVDGTPLAQAATMRSLSHSALLTLLTLSVACGGGEADDTDSDTDVGESVGTSSSSAVSDSDPSPTYSEEAECVAPEAREDVDFVFEHATLADFVDLDLDCIVDGTSTGGEVSAAIDLSCTDAEKASHVVRIGLRLFHDATLVLVAGDALTLTYRTNQDIGDYREWLSLRGADESLQLFAMRGYSVLTPEAAPLWAPLEIAQISRQSCEGEDYGQCHIEQRTGLDVTQGDSTQRIYDRNWAALASGLAVHVGKAKMVDRYPNEGCAGGDSVDGLQIRMIVVGES